MALRLAVCSAFPPNRGPLSEYAWHVVQSLRKSPQVEHVYVIADRGEPAASPDDDRVSVHQCWSFNRTDKPVAVTRMARRLAVDAVWFQMHMTSGGSTRLSQFASLAAPAICRCAGVPTVVTLHNMLGLTDVKSVYPAAGPIDVLGGHLATALLRLVDEVCVTLPEYAALMRARYGIRARYVPLGTPGRSSHVVPRPSDRPPVVLAFGRFGSYKRLEIVFEAVDGLQREGTPVRLVIAGSDARRTPGYLAGVLDRYRHIKNVEFLGYVPELAVEALFSTAAACILPYATATGMSSVATQAAMYGVPIVASDVPGVRLFQKEGLRLHFFDWPDTESLKDTLRSVLAATPENRQDVLHNLAYCRAQSMDKVVNEYLCLIETLVASRSRGTYRPGATTPAAPRLK